MIRLLFGLFALLAVQVGAQEVYRLAEGEELRSDGAGELELEVEGLPEHGLLKLTLDLEVRVPQSQYDRESSRGERESQEVLEIVAGQKMILNASLSSRHFSQSFPDALGGFCHPPQTGSKKGWAGSQRYRFELVIPHGQSTLELGFAWLAKIQRRAHGKIEGQEGEWRFIEGSEPFVVKGLVVEVVEPLALDGNSARKLLDQISSGDPLLAQAAVQKLVQAGDAALPYVCRRFGLAAEPDPDQMRVIERLVKQLDSDTFTERLRAKADLLALGPEFLSDFGAAVADPDLSVGARLGLQQARGRLAKRARISNQILANRLRPALALSDSEVAEALLDVLPKVKTLHYYLAPYRARITSLREQVGQREMFDALLDELPPIDGVLLPPALGDPEIDFDDPRLDLVPRKK